LQELLQGINIRPLQRIRDDAETLINVFMGMSHYKET
jgi:hypothetical protein